MSKKFTIKEIAELCGVGKSTVSRVLNNDPKVSESTREKIQKVIQEIGFQPNRSARAMRGVEEPVVGIIVSHLHLASEAETLRTILAKLYENNITPIIVESQFKPELVEHHLALFKQRQVTGVIVFSFSNLPEEIVSKWKESIVVVARSYPTISSIYYDDRNAISALMEKLYQQGHREIAYLGVEDSDETTGWLRTQSYLDFCRTHQILPNYIQTKLDIESAYQDCDKLFEKPNSVLLCATSSLAVGAYKYLQKNHQNRPLACIGKQPLFDYFIPNLVSLDFGYSQAGEWAVELLLAQLNGDQAIVHRCVPYHLS